MRRMRSLLQLNRTIRTFSQLTEYTNHSKVRMMDDSKGSAGATHAGIETDLRDR